MNPRSPSAVGCCSRHERPTTGLGRPTASPKPLKNPRVAEALSKLRAMFPPVRVQHLLLRADAERGPYTGQAVSLARLFKKLTMIPPPSVPNTPLPPLARRDLRTRSLPFPVPIDSKPVDPDGKIVALYWSVLVAMAALLNTVLEPAARDTRAA